MQKDLVNTGKLQVHFASVSTEPADSTKAVNSPRTPSSDVPVSEKLVQKTGHSSGDKSNDRYVNTIDLPGAGDHPILRMPIDQLRDTSIDLLMSSYGEAEGGPTCGADYGNLLLKRWRETKKGNCIQRQNGGSKLNSNIDCYLMHQNHHHGNGDNLCVMENVAMNLGIFGNDQFTRPIIDHYVATRHADQPYPKFPAGFITGDCETQQEHWQSRVMPGWNADLTTGAFQHIKDLKDASQVQCDTWVEHPVLMQERDTFANFFHDSEDFVNVFLAMAVLQWKPKDTQIFLMDLYPEGPFWNMWKEVFSHDYPAYSAFDLKNHYGVPNGQSNYVCFRKLAVGIYGPAAPTTICSWDHPCKKTALLRAYSDFVIRTLDLQHKTHYASQKPKKEVVITYMSRRPSKEWPEKKYCDDEHSFFRCQLWANFGPRSLGRMVRNDEEVISALQNLQSEKFANGAVVKITAVDFNILSFKEQIEVDLQTDIMVGPHGAGLMHNIFMRDRASLIELFIDGSSANRHFHNLAGWYGRKYEGVGMSNPVNINELTRIIRKHVESIDLNSY
jgi:hypothetical protein